jgi:hypothetical protein
LALCAALTLTSAGLAARLPEAKSTRGATVASLGVVLPKGAGPVLQNIAALLARQVQRRSGAKVELGGAAALRVELAIEPGIGREGFKISDGPDAILRIAGNDPRGVLYGVGKFLHTSRYSEGGFTPGAWRGASVPQKAVRGIYLATHMGNFYDAAPVAEVRQYVQELGLWGFNSLMVWYDMRIFAGFHDPKAIAFRERLGQILQAARDLGMGTAIVVIANEGDRLTPPAIRAKPGAERGDNSDTYLCVNAAGGLDYLRKVMSAEFAWVRAFEPEYLALWGHDPGGCGCARCAPGGVWGSNGYLQCAQAVALLGKQELPGAKIILSTWLFDPKEWEGLHAKFRDKPDWCDLLMSDGIRAGGLPSVDFPEISMSGNYPWGGFGSNAMPATLRARWDRYKRQVEGGWPYSEGIFEDLNKICFSQWYWGDRPAADVIREYAAFEFSPAVADDVVKVVQILERNTTSINASTREAFALVRQIDAKLPVQARQTWRWRILYLRAQINQEMLERNPGKGLDSRGARLDSKVLQQAFRELTKIYHAENALEYMKPPVIQ